MPDLNTERKGDPVNVFVIASGQDDNIGDVVLRRRMLAALSGLGPRHVFVHKASPGFREGLLLGPDDRFYDDYRTWLRACTMTGLTSRLLLMHNAGELVGNRDIAKRHLSLIPASLLARLRGHGVVRIGSGMRDSSGRWLPVIRAVAWLDSVTIWRDATSRSYFGRGDVQPDWAFDATLPHSLSGLDMTGERRYLAISMRSDRPLPPDAWFEALQIAARSRGLEPLVVTQVRRDNQLGAEIARRLGSQLIAWDDASHLEQERTVREIYRQSALVVSDRLHALVIGLTEGAVPVGAIAWNDVKLARHFAAAGIEDISFDVRPMSVSEITGRIGAIVERRDEFLRAAESAAAAVAAIDLRPVGHAQSVQPVVEPAVGVSAR